VVARYPDRMAGSWPSAMASWRRNALSVPPCTICGAGSASTDGSSVGSSRDSVTLAIVPSRYDAYATPLVSSYATEAAQSW